MAKIIPIASVDASPAGLDGAACDSAEPFALMVLGDSMLPEFEDGDVVVIEPAGLAQEGSFVLAYRNKEWLFRQLVKNGRQWLLHAVNPAYPDLPIATLEAVRGVIIQKSKPGRRRSIKRYV
ncbi:MAG: S24 family peptidase [Sterolibacterium sp.]|jgi:SOS-response transcriptional repressor LexA